MASSFDSLDLAGSPENPSSSVIHLCMSVNRTVSGSVSGYLSVRAMAMSSKLSQSNVCGMVFSKPLMIQFFRVVLIPLGDFDNDIRGAVWHRLATEARLRRNAWRFVEFVELRVGRFVAGFEAFANDDVAGRAGADAATGVVEAGL